MVGLACARPAQPNSLWWRYHQSRRQSRRPRDPPSNEYLLVPSGCDMLTLFTWGYWGWGNATHELIRAVDATERERGFKPPVFFDIRASRSVRARGFRDDAFEQLLPKGR